MTRTAKRPLLIVLACFAAIGLAAPPVAGAERIAMVVSSLPAKVDAARPMKDRVITLTLAPALHRPGIGSRVHFHKGASSSGWFEAPNFPAQGKRGRAVRRGKSLRIDLFRLKVAQSVEGEGPFGPTGKFSPEMIHIGVKQGATPGSKAVGVGMAVAPNVVVESRLGPGGESDTGVRFRLLY